eukprot:scaffold4235_cov56-Attheya_sp.AAC.3
MVSSLAAAVAAASITPAKPPAPKLSSLAAAVATTTETKEGKKPAPDKTKHHAVRETTPHDNNPPNKASGNKQDKTGANVSQKKKASPHHNGKITKKKEPHNKSEEHQGNQQQSGDKGNRDHHQGASSKRAGTGSHEVNSNRGQLRHDNKKHVDAKQNQNLIETGGKHPLPGNINRGNNASRTGHTGPIRSDHPQGTTQTRRDDNKPLVHGSRAEALKNAQGSRRDDGTSKNNYKQVESRVNNATTNSRGDQRGKSRRDDNKHLKNGSRIGGLKDAQRGSNTESTSKRWNKSNNDISDRNNSGGMSQDLQSRNQNIQERSEPPPRIKVSPLRGRWADESDEED